MTISGGSSISLPLKSWSPDSAYLHLDFYLSTDKYKRFVNRQIQKTYQMKAASLPLQWLLSHSATIAKVNQLEGPDNRDISTSFKFQMLNMLINEMYLHHLSSKYFLICYLFLHFTTAGQILNQFVRTPSPKLDSVIPEVVTYKQQSTFKQVFLDIWLYFCSFTFISFLSFVFLYMLICIFCMSTSVSLHVITCISHLGYAQNMEVWCLSW